MFGLSLPCQLIQGPAIRTWNCVAHFANLLWCKFNYTANPAMPRSRRRHHSRSRTKSRSRSPSCERDRDTKRRKIENYDSPQHKRSDSPEENQQPQVFESAKGQDESIESIHVHSPSAERESNNTRNSDREDSSTSSVATPTVKASKTPQKPLTPKQLQKSLEKKQKLKEREKLKEEKLRVIEEKKKLKLEENEKRIKEKREKLEQKQKEIEERQKNRDLKEEKRKKEREERELKRKEKEEKEEQKRREQDEKNKEKQKMQEKKQKAATAFVSFFTKKSELQNDDRTPEKSNTYTFMPFEIKSDMRVAPICRVTLDDDQKNFILESLTTQLEQTYLDELKTGRKIRKSFKTWPCAEFDRQDDDVVIVEDVVPGESIEEQQKPRQKLRAKFLKFNDNRRPAYFGTWRKTSSIIKARRPFAIDTAHFDYDIDSDEEWEEEDSGESLQGSDDDKENDSENEYEEDNEFFVPHGHLSDDEVNDEENSTESPEAHKAKLKLLKKEFEEEMRSKTEKIKPRVIGCIWYNKDGSNVDPAIDEFLKPLSIISNGQILIKKRSKFSSNTTMRRSFLPGKELSTKFIPDFLKWIHGSSKNSKALVEDFLKSLEKRDINAEVSKTSLVKQLKKLAVWTRSPEGGPVLKKHCWFVHKNIGEEYNVDLSITN